MSEVVIGPDNEVLDFRLHNYHENGWYFGAGDPEFWQLTDKLLKPGGRLLDIGMGEARASLFFALNGMAVVGVDINPKRIEAVKSMAEDLSAVMPFDMKAVESDPFTQPLPEGKFDSVIIGQMVHIESKQKALELFDKALDALKPGGHIWIRAAGKESDAYDELSWYAAHPSQYEFEFVDADVIEHPCICSGEWAIEPTLFFDPLDLHVYFADRGCKVVHSQTIPTEGKMNIMYGEDYNPDNDIERGGMITVLAQKPKQE
ncbi:class I SAM-dependent methyltransferase [Candidatus Saccharibacteria bacterium]|nr:class I SAM-dependent methyltransferase [Candidatus Saccharibacteria bacterium]